MMSTTKPYMKIIFIIAFGITGTLAMFELSKQAPIHHFTQTFQTFTDASLLPKNYQLRHVNEDLIPHLRRRMLWGLLAGLAYGYLMMRYLLWAIKRGTLVKK